MEEKKRSIVAQAESLYYSGRCDEAIAILKDSFSSDQTRADTLTSLVELLLDSERYENAMDFLGCFSSSGNYPMMTFQRALCLEATGQYLLAEILAEKLVESDKLRAEALALKARLMLRVGRNEAAEAIFRMAVESDNSCSRAWFGLASIKQRNEELTGAFELLKKAFLCSPESRVITTAFHESSVDGSYLMQSEKAFREALKRRPMNRRLRFLLIDLLLRQAKFREAMYEIELVLVDFGVDQGVIAAGLKVRERLGGARILEEPSLDGSVSLCMIVRNERNHLARCLHSTAPLVDEIIVVDTGSIDETKDIARVFGARVYDFPWVDDYSKARNHALSWASGDWVLVLDADEALSRKDDEEFRRSIATMPDRPGAYRIQTRNYTFRANVVGFNPNRGEFPEERGLGWYPSDKVRLFTNDARIRFEYPVHELLEPSLQRLKIPVRDCPVVVHHYGTLEDSCTLEKTKKYRVLERKKLNRDLKNKSALRELAVQASQVGNHSEALDLWRRFLKLQPRSAEAYLNIGAASCNLGKLEAAISFAHKALQLDPALKEAKFNKAIALLLMGQGGEAKKLLEGLSEEQPDYFAAQFLLCVANVCLREETSAENIFKKLRNLPIGEHIGEAFSDMAQRFQAASRPEYARLTLDAALNFGCGNPAPTSYNRCEASV